MAVFWVNLKDFSVEIFVNENKKENGRTVVKCKTPSWEKEEEMIHTGKQKPHTHIQVVEYDD